MKVPHTWPGKEKSRAMAVYIIMSNQLGEGWVDFCEQYLSASRRKMKLMYPELADAAHATNSYNERKDNADIQQRS